jgi:ATP-dependent Zn protease
MKEQLAKRSAGLSLANLESVIGLASRAAVKQNVPLNDEILEEAFETSRHGEKKDWGEGYMERVARHESGHAFMCYEAGSTPAYLTIVARGGHGGYMEHDSEDGSPLKTREELLGRIRTSLGGRAAEIAYYGDEAGISTGASGDLEQATRVARAMICSYGMDDEFGMAVMGQEEATRGPLAEKVSRRVSEMIKTEMERTVAVITEAKPRIDRLVERLLEKNRLDKQEIETLLEK